MSAFLACTLAPRKLSSRILTAESTAKNSGGTGHPAVAEQKRGAYSSSQIHRAVVFHLSRPVNILRLNENETNRDEVAVRARAMPDGLPRRSSPAEVSGGCACLAGRGAHWFRVNFA